MRYLAVAVVVLSSLVPCRAQNLLPNPEFDHDLSGWLTGSESPPAFFWDNTLSVGPGGSVLIHPIAEATSCLVACVPVTAGVVYSFGGQYQFPSQAGTHEVQIIVNFSKNADCIQGGLGQVYSPRRDPSITPPGQWWVLAGSDVTAPPGAVAAEYDACQFAGQFSRDPISSFDDLYFGPQGTVGPRQVVDVPALSWTGLCALVCGLSTAALWVLRKGRRSARAGA